MDKEDGPSTDSLERVINRLIFAWEAYQADSSNELVCESLVKRFELTYEVSNNLLRKFLVFSSESEKVREMTFPKLIKYARGEQNLLLGDWEDWKKYRKTRGKSSHTYGEEIVPEVAALIPQFLSEVEHLRDKIKERLS